MDRPLSLYELNALLREGVRELFPNTYWVQAEVSSCSCRNAAGHCYLELIEKDRKSDAIKAKAKANIWRNTWNALRVRFELQTGAPLSVGQKILVEVQVDFHEVYGMSLNVVDIDPSYTLGDWALRRKEILQQLAKDGVLELNKELDWPVLPQRIAIVSSQGAAGYGDFMHQLYHSPFAFYTKLFPALVQGERAAQSIIAALEAVAAHVEQFDVVVIIRGGGAVTDLSCFDDYELASAVAQFPLPILAGIGHERDCSVVDEVAHLSVKTPTAAAEYLVGCLQEQISQVEEAAEALKQRIVILSERENNRIQQDTLRLHNLMKGLCHREDMKMQRQLSRLQQACSKVLWNGNRMLLESYSLLRHLTDTILTGSMHRLELAEKEIQSFSPELQLRRGYSLTTVNGKVLRDASAVQPGTHIETHLSKGILKSIVE